ncbi:MAG: heparan-alpha-glucosaminide N-acetyltransferase domain-containing protein [Puia sp.]
MTRIKSLDIARGFTVLMIAPIHTMMVFSSLSLRSILPAQILAFIAEWHGAQIFMLLMGLSFSFSKDRSPKSVFQRAGKLLVVAYVLNIFKFLIPHYFGWLPPQLLQELQIQNSWHGYMQLFLLGDILHFASVAMIILFFVSKFPSNRRVELYIAAGICLFSPLFWDAGSNNLMIDYCLHLFGGEPPAIFFPVLPWLIYPLLGLYIGRILQKKDQWIGFDSFWIIGLGILIIASLLKYFLHEDSISSFYRTTPLDTLLHVGFALIILSVWHWISRNVKANILFQLFTYASRYITQIYIIQWIVICWLLPFTGYHRTGFFGTGFLIMLTSIITLFISLLINISKSMARATTTFFL